jgi:general secretion pathway protein N
LALLGAISGEGASTAIFLDETTKSVVRVKVGDRYAGWTLTEVQGREAKMQRADLLAVLSLP